MTTRQQHEPPTNTRFLKLTSRFGTPFYVRKDLIACVEGFDFPKNQGPPEGHRGARLNVMSSQYSETYVCLETSEEVIQLLDAVHRADQAHLSRTLP